MSNQPRVSVIIIFFDAEKFLQEAIDSVFSQSYKNWELLLIDDGSTDGSTECARMYAYQYPDKVHLLEHEGHQNRGMSASRNLGIEQASGEYLAFLDADDTWYPNILQEQLNILEAYPQAALVYGPLYWWYSWAGNTDDHQQDYIEQLGVSANKLIKPPQLFTRFLRDKAAVPSGFMVRKDSVVQYGGFEDVFQGEYEDQVFCAKICLNAPIYVSGSRWYRYRQHSESSVAIGQKTGQSFTARLLFLDWLESYLKKQRITNLAVWWALWLEMIPYKHQKLHKLKKYTQYYLDRTKYWWKIFTRHPSVG